MKSLVLAVLVVGLAVVLAVLFWSPGAAPVSVAGSGTADGTARAAASESGLEAGGARGELATPASVADARATAGASPDPAQSATRVRGRIRAPAGCFDDGPVRVFALSAEGDVESLFHALQREEKLGVDQGDGDDDGLGMAAASSATDAGAPRIVARADARDDLTFEIAVPSGQSTAHLHVLGHYWFTSHSTRVQPGGAVLDIALAPECGTAIAGDVVLPEGVDPSALAKLGIALRTSIEGRSGAIGELRGTRRRTEIRDGRFEFRALDARAGYDLVIEPETLAALRASPKDLVPGRETRLRLSLLRGAVVKGVVKGPGGTPIEGARVEARVAGRMFGFDDPRVRARRSGPDGLFELPAVTPGELKIVAQAEGFLASDPVKVDARDGGLVNGVVLQLDVGRSVSGSVTWADGSPAADVKVHVGFDLSQLAGLNAFNAVRGAEGDARTDAAGRFAIGGLGAGPFTVTASGAPRDATASPDATSDPKSVAARLQRARKDGVQPGTADLALVLRPALAVKGRVTDASGAAIAKYRVEATSVGEGLLGDLGQDKSEQQVDDPRGEFTLLVERAGSWKVWAVADGFAHLAPVEIVVPRAETDPLVLVLQYASAVRGVVKDPSGAPVANATVETAGDEANWQKALSTHKRPETKSDAEGRFTLSGLTPGRVALVADHENFAPSLALDVDLTPRETREAVVIVLRQGGTLTGDVFEAGKPAVGFMVQVTAMNVGNQQIATTDSKGAFRVEHLEPGSYQVVAFPTNALESTNQKGDGAPDMSAMMSSLKIATASITDGEETHVVLGAPPEDPVRVHGSVTLAGEGYEGAFLSFMLEGQGVASAKIAQIGKDGAYSIQVDKPGDYMISIQKISGKPGEQTTIEYRRKVPKQREHALDFELPLGRISGRVTNPKGEPASGARVSLEAEDVQETGTIWGGQYHELSTDGEGRFDLRVLRPGRYTLTVGGLVLGGMLGGGAPPARASRSGLKLSAGEWMKDVDFRLEEPGTVEVEVVDEAGNPVKDAAIFARDARGRVLDRLGALSTKKNGIAKYTGLGSGEYTFRARLKGSTSGESAPVRLSAGETKKVRVELRSGTKLVVTTLDADGQPLPTALYVFDEAGHEVGQMVSLAEVMEMMGAQGFSTTVQRAGPLPAGKYKVRADRGGGEAREKLVTLAGEPEIAITLQFGP